VKFFKSKNNFQFCHPELDSGSSILNSWIPGQARNDTRRSFTLIELLVVLALVTILSVVVVLTLNPAELLKQARDSNRLSDLATINTALNLFSTDVIGGFMGTSTVVYVSIPSATSTCSNLGLPTLPTGYTYNCVTSQNLRNTDGTGWIPVNFGRISSNSPISQLPIDPINTTTTRLYYIYAPGGSWELNASIEASKNKLGGANDLTSKDGGSAPSLYELGNNLNLNPIEQGDPTLVGYWNFEEGPNATSTDRSGYGNHGTWYGTSTQEQHYAAGKVGSYAGSFNGVNDYIDIGDKTSLRITTNQISITSWVKPALFTTSAIIINKEWSYEFAISNGGAFQAAIETDAAGGWNWGGTKTIPLDQFSYVAFVYDGAYWNFYINGSLVERIPPIGGQVGNITSAISSFKIANRSITSAFLNGFLDDIRIYNRALSAAEVLAFYNAAK
jgi:prepilin-type N-terminal cleavage/methylation domain-containing protein